MAPNRDVRFVSIVLISTVFLSGCVSSPEMPSIEQLSCTWTSSSDGSVVQLEEDGTLLYTNLRMEVVDPLGAKSGAVSGESTWIRGDGVRMVSGGYPVLSLQVDSETWNVNVMKSGDEMTLTPRYPYPGPSEEYVMVATACAG